MKPLNWRSLFRELAEGWNWTPEQIGGLTYYQARMLICDKKQLGGIQKVSVHDAEKMGYTGLTEAGRSVEDTYATTSGKPRSKRGRRRR
tara:strand:+ start:289 stop:555 length:267 start_codon:yes stop_codon:yes gene_type:complete